MLTNDPRILIKHRALIGRGPRQRNRMHGYLANKKQDVKFTYVDFPPRISNRYHKGQGTDSIASVGSTSPPGQQYEDSS